jgi:hypothetical protein
MRVPLIVQLAVCGVVLMLQERLHDFRSHITMLSINRYISHFHLSQQFVSSRDADQ